ncbi:MAG: hypothetical protein HFG39_02330 [Lachnospiraceae bacterium]|nr:hypothetical protein [Lachnospiraceae bacterium]
MTALEVCLVLIGITAIVVSYFISEKVSYEKLEEAARNLVLSEESKEKLINQTKETVKNILEDMTEDIAGKAERELEKLSNEKIMSVHDYSNTILEEINKNHNEVMFLYSMLDDKDKEIKNTVHKVQDTIKSIRRMEEELEEQEAVAEPEGIVPEIQPEEISMLLDTEEKDDLKNNNDIILQLHKEGKSNLEIARALGLGLGEVKLVLDLFQGVMP